MRTVILVSVTEEGQLELPPEIQAKLHPGDEYMVWETEDTILFKKIKKTLELSDLLQRIEELGADTEQPTLEEISEIVREVRSSRSTG